MSINLNANSSNQIIASSAGITNHDVIDLANRKAYSQIHATDDLTTGDAVVLGALAKDGDFRLTGIAIHAISDNNWGFVQSFGFGSAKVVSGTPANSFLVPADPINPGTLRAIDLDDPEFVSHVLALLDQRLPNGSQFPTNRWVVSITAESGGTASVFIF